MDEKFQMSENLPQPNYYSIGELAKLLEMPTSTLRYYDAQGLLVPEIRKNNKYRYYSEEQILDAMNIIQLKRMGISLQNIKLILEHKKLGDVKNNLEELLEKYQKEIDELEKQKAYVTFNYNQLKKSMNLLNNMFSEKNGGSILDLYDKDMGYDFEYKIGYMKKTQAVAKRFLNKFYIELKSSLQLNDYIKQNNLVLAGPLTIIFYDEAEERFKGGKYEVEMLYPIEKTDFQDSLIVEYGGYYTFSTLHLGAYDDLPHVFERLRKKIKDKNFEIIGSPYEEYLLDYYYLNNKDIFLTRVGYPIKYNDKVKDEIL